MAWPDESKKTSIPKHASQKNYIEMEKKNHIYYIPEKHEEETKKKAGEVRQLLILNQSGSKSQLENLEWWSYVYKKQRQAKSHNFFVLHPTG